MAQWPQGALDLSVPCVRFSSARSCGYCHQDLKVIHTVRKLNIVDIVLQLSLWGVCVEVTVTTPLNAVRNMYVKRKRHCPALRAALTFSISASVARAATKASCGTSTRPTIFMRFLPSFCFSKSLRLREISPP